ncbi:hypothetical protein LCGC14_0576910 [marine sediment metagenome]|uniref:Uncharacterized protein n=1 Tax=marine sediment metagenome TaxID=412755 RepID=A0A0F9RMI2_9ZZZZ
MGVECIVKVVRVGNSKRLNFKDKQIWNQLKLKVKDEMIIEIKEMDQVVPE